MRMLGIQTYKHVILLASTALLLSSCVAPLVIGGGTAAAMMASREKGIKGAASDTSLSTKVKMKLYQFNPDLHAKVAVNVQNGEVILMGIVKEPSWKEDAERLAKEVEGVITVVNNIETEGEEDLGMLSSDSWITTRIKSSLMVADDVCSLNYSIKTINGIVYVTGTAQDQTELNKVLEIASNIGGVKKVVNHVKIKGQLPPTSTPESSVITATELPPPEKSN